jgi:alkanesulfonate monooxygenase SsuD/methylene tetrahydromethanopterin reductase-like flavin-dependent oxidoreductase (luciferase family)
MYEKILFCLEHALVSKGNTLKQTSNNSLGLTKEAEANHYKRYWFAEHHNTKYNGGRADNYWELE